MPDEWFRDFKIKNGIAIIVLFAWAVTMMIGCITTGLIVRRKTTDRVTAEVTSQLRAGFQDYLNQVEAEQKKNSFLAGEASLEAAIIDLADSFDELLAVYSMEFGVTEDGCRTVGWVFIARLITGSSEFGKTPQEIIEKKGAWEGKVVGHAVRDQDTALAREIAREYLTGHYPDGFTPNMTFGAREAGGGFVARTEFITGPNTVYWRYGK